MLQPTTGGAMRRTPDDETLLALARTVMGISTAAADRLGGISVVQLRALTVLRDLGTATLGEVAVGMGVTVSTASRLVDRLVTGGLVRRELSPRSRRALALRVAPDGDTVLDRYDEDRLEALRTALGRLPDGDRTSALAAFAAFSGAFETAVAG
jgi:DNA-binding MarR family transcriptional regulator